MKILVDKLPDKPRNCVFSKHFHAGIHEGYKCNVTGGNCVLFNNKCNVLLEYKQYKKS